jgi:hypothetical protein
MAAGCAQGHDDAPQHRNHSAGKVNDALHRVIEHPSAASDASAQLARRGEWTNATKSLIIDLIRWPDFRRLRWLHAQVVDAARMPFIARNTKLGWEDGQPGILTMNRGKQVTNRAAACPRSFPRLHGGSCDEFPMAPTDEGGAGARAEEVPVRENSCQGGSYGKQYPQDGARFLVVISNPDLIAVEAFTGTDIAKENGLC